MTALHALPGDLPEPLDDGACDQLPGQLMPASRLPATDGSTFDLADLADFVLYVYPRTGGPHIVLPPDWDSIPGARGCTPQS